MAVLAGDPLFNGGAWGAAASRKITRFVDLAQTFHLPVVHLVDCFGFAVGLEAESTATMRHAVTAISAIHQSTVPWAAIIIRNVFGVGGGAHVPHTQTPMRYAWPSGNWGSLPLEGGVEAAYRAEIAAADDPAAKLKEIEERLEQMRSPFRSAEAFIIDEIIDPRDTRPLLCQWANMAAPAGCSTSGTVLLHHEALTHAVVPFSRSADWFWCCAGLLRQAVCRFRRRRDQDRAAGRRSAGDRAADRREGGESGYFAWLNTNKRSVTETPAALQLLLAGADVLLDGRGYDGAVPEDVSVTRLSWFGEDGPYSGFAGTDAIVRALGGLVALTGRADGPPTLATDHQSSIVAGIAAFIATAAGLFDRQHGSRRFSVSTHEAAVAVAEYEAAVAWDASGSRRRPGVNLLRAAITRSASTQRGTSLVGVTIVTPGQWRGMCAMMGMPELAKNPRYAINVDRLAHAKEIDALFGPVWQTKSAMEWFTLALEYKLPIVMVPTMEELLELSVHRARGAFGPVRIGDAAFDAPVLPQHLTRSPPRSGGTAPLAGEDEAKWHSPPNGWPAHAASADRRPLEGVRIIDLTMGWAGPTAARHLSDLGAEIIKVEACQYPDWWRGTDLRASFIAEQKYEKILWFQLMNRNKLGITLDLTNPGRRRPAEAHGRGK